MTSSEDVTRSVRTPRLRRARNRAAAGLVAASLGGGVIALAVSDSSDPDRTALLGPGTSDTTLPPSVLDDQDAGLDVETSTSPMSDEAASPAQPATTLTQPPRPTPTTTRARPQKPTTTEPTTTTVTTPTTVPNTTPYDVVIDLPVPQHYESWPYPPSPDYTLVGDPWIERGNSSDGTGCVWLEDEAGTRLSIVWPPGWTARLRGNSTQPPHVAVRDQRGRVQATNDRVVGIVGGEVDKTVPFCDVGEKTFEVRQIGPN